MFQRDRDRIVHSSSFRRLVYKTQVFLNHEGDLYRTRLTHSLEVAQIGRSIARTLRLNEDLVEAIALAHDVGHTPFGHAGQDALNSCMAEHGGFEHNLQSLRVVDKLEVRYPGFNGLNLTFETREGILKHCSRRHAEHLEHQEPGGVARRFLDRTQPSLEAQLCNLADEMAYCAHDMDDGVRSGLVSVEQLLEVRLFGQFHEQARRRYPDLSLKSGDRRFLYEVMRRMLGALVHDVIDTTALAISMNLPDSVDTARLCPPLVQLSEGMQQMLAESKQFLFGALYRHPKVIQTNQAAQQIIGDLFAAYVNQESLFPAAGPDLNNRTRSIADYIAGMTDRFALREHEKLTGLRLLA